MVKVDRFTIPVFFFSSEYRIFFLVSANLSPCHKTLEENPIYLPEPGSAELPITRKALLFDETIEQWIRSGDLLEKRASLILLIEFKLKDFYFPVEVR